MLIDFHTHIFPEKIAVRAVEILEANLRANLGECPECHAKKPGNLAALKSSMKCGGVDISVVLPIATTVTQSESINTFAKKITDHDGIISFGSVHPNQGNVEEEMHKIKELGLKGIKLHPDYQRFFINSPESIRVLKLAEKLDLAVVLHSGVDSGVPHPVHCSPELLADALNHVSGKKIVAAHMGGFLMYEDVLKYLAKTDIIFDTAYCLDTMPKDIAMEIINTHGADKMLFATDFPWKEATDILPALKNLPLTKEEFDMITYKNACRLLGIGEK